MTPAPSHTATASASAAPTSSFSSLPYELRSDIVRHAFPTLADQCRGMLVSKDFYVLVGDQRPFSDMAREHGEGRRGDNVRALGRYVASLPEPTRDALRGLWQHTQVFALAPLGRVRPDHRRALVAHDPRFWGALPREDRGDRALAASAVGRCQDVYRLLPRALRADPSLAAAAVGRSLDALCWLPPSLSGQREVLLACIPHWLSSLDLPADSSGTVARNHPVVREAANRLTTDLSFASDAARADPRVMKKAGGSHHEALPLCFAHLSQPGRHLPKRRGGGPYPVALLPAAIASHPGNLFRFPSPHWWLGDRFARAIESGGRPPRSNPSWVDLLAERPLLAATLVERWPELWDDLSPPLRARVEVARGYVAGGGRLPVSSPLWNVLQDDVELARSVARTAPGRLAYFSDACLADREVVRARIRYSNAFPIFDFRHTYHDDAELLLTAAARNSRALGWASSRLMRDPAFVLQALAAHKAPPWFDRVHRLLRDDARFMLAAIKRDWQCYAWASERLRADGDFMRQAVHQDGKILLFDRESLLFDDAELFKVALRSARESLRPDSFALSFPLDQSYALAAIANSAINFSQLPAELQNNRTVAEAAVCKDGSVFRWLPEALKDDGYLFLLAMAHTKDNLLRNASPRLQRSNAVLEMAFPLAAHVFAQASFMLDREQSSALTDAYLRAYPQALFPLTHAQTGSPEARLVAAFLFSQLTKLFPTIITSATVPPGFPASVAMEFKRLRPDLWIAESAEE